MLPTEAEAAVEAEITDLKAELQEHKPSGQPPQPQKQQQSPWPARLEV